VQAVVEFWVKANKSNPKGVTAVNGTTKNTTHEASEGGATTEFVVDAAGGHG
jgi:hypothetical protein